VPEGDLAAQIIGPPMEDTFRAMELGEFTDDAIAAYRADYGDRGWAMNTLFDGIETLLADLRGTGVRLAVATSKLEPTAERILAHFDPRATFRGHRRCQPGRLAQEQGGGAGPRPWPSFVLCPSGC